MKITEILCHGQGPAASFAMLKSVGTVCAKNVTEVKLGLWNRLMFQAIFSKSGIKSGKHAFCPFQ